MGQSLKRGDKVRWDPSQGETHGRFVKKQTSPTMIKGHKAVAPKNNPEYSVKSDKSGKTAVHKLTRLKKT